MPFKSEKQRRYMHVHHPQIAARWEKEGGVKPDGGLKAMHQAQKRRARTLAQRDRTAAKLATGLARKRAKRFPKSKGYRAI